MAAEPHADALPSSHFWRQRPDGVSVAVRVHPAARRPGVHGAVSDTHGMRLKIDVSEAPEEGRANRAACALLAAALNVPGTSIAVIHGATSRQKTLHVAGDPAALAQKLAAL
jgi:uncharacterized protein YggU (UPF0235/DUF167 family)